MVTFLRNTVHAILTVPGKPAIFLTVDTPRRIPDDVHFVDPAEASARAFVTHRADYPARL